MIVTSALYSQSQCSIPSGLLKLPDVSNKIPTNNLIAGQFPRRISLVTAVVNPSTRDSSSRYLRFVVPPVALNAIIFFLIPLLSTSVRRGYKEDTRGACHGHLCGGNDGRKAMTNTLVIRLYSIMDVVLSLDPILRKLIKILFPNSWKIRIINQLSTLELI